MSDTTKIEWCDATFNPWWGCTRISPGCDHCYADTWAHRLGLNLWDNGERRAFGDKHWNEPLKWTRTSFYECPDCDWRGENEASGCPKCAAEIRTARRRVFCASMADVFDKDAPEGARVRLWKLIAATPELDWLLLTKRIGNVARMLPADWGSGYQNVWLGISVVNQDEADRDIPKLLAAPARIRFLSCEPLLGPISLYRPHAIYATDPANTNEGATVLDWVISGGESGTHARPSHPDWHRFLRDQCAAAGVPFLFKQWGEWAPFAQTDMHPKRAEHVFRTDITIETYGGPVPYGIGVRRIGKKAAGRVLDGVEHNGFPA